MNRVVFLLSMTALLAGCGAGDYADVVGGFQSSIVYVANITPQPLESDVITRNLRTEAVFTNPPDCADIATAQVCTDVTFLPDSVTVNLIWEPKKNYRSEPLSQIPSPVTISSATITFDRLTAGCPDLNSKYVAVGATLSQNNSELSISLDIISQDMKENIVRNYGDQVTYIYLDDSGCTTAFPVLAFDTICTYRVRITLHGIELYTDEREDIKAELTIRLSDFLSGTDGCQI